MKAIKFKFDGVISFGRIMPFKNVCKVSGKEDICSTVAEEIFKVIRPKWLKVTVYLEGNPDLTDWKVSKKLTKKNYQK